MDPAKSHGLQELEKLMKDLGALETKHVEIRATIKTETARLTDEVQTIKNRVLSNIRHGRYPVLNDRTEKMSLTSIVLHLYQLRKMQFASVAEIVRVKDEDFLASAKNFLDLKDGGAKEVDRKLRQLTLLRWKLFQLGFSQKARNDLEAILLDMGMPDQVRKQAAWIMARWLMERCSPSNADQCLELLSMADSPDSLDYQPWQVAILKAECYLILGQTHRAKSVIQQAQEREENPDLYFALANCTDSLEQRIDLINKGLSVTGVTPIFIGRGRGSYYDGLCAGTVLPKQVGDTKVTIIVPLFNAEETVRQTLDSILAQTWQRLEILVVDDWSTDRSVDVVRSYERQDSRIKLIQTEVNGGPYAARNVALQIATGEFVTCNDSDDWSHPQKIEVQVRDLIANPHLVANLSTWARTTNDLQFYRRGNPGFFVQKNISSLMFRRKIVTEKLGFWDSVRFAADSELINRMIKSFGPASVKHLPQVLSFGRSLEGSLTENKTFGYPGYLMGARKEYFEAQTYHHNTAVDLRYNFPEKKRPFAVPDAMLMDRTPRGSFRFFDVAVAFDFSCAVDQIVSTVAREIEEAKSRGLRCALVPMAIYGLTRKGPMNPVFRGLLDGCNVQTVVYGERITCTLLVVRHPAVLQEKQAYIPEVTADNIAVVVDSLPSGPDDQFCYSINSCTQNLMEYFRDTGWWYPANNEIRKALYVGFGEVGRKLRFSPTAWPGLADASGLQKLRLFQETWV